MEWSHQHALYSQYCAPTTIGKSATDYHRKLQCERPPQDDRKIQENILTDSVQDVLRATEVWRSLDKYGDLGVCRHASR